MIGAICMMLNCLYDTRETRKLEKMSTTVIRTAILRKLEEILSEYSNDLDHEITGHVHLSSRHNETLWESIRVILEVLKSSFHTFDFLDASTSLLFLAWDSSSLKYSKNIYRILENHILNKSASKFHFLFKNDNQVELWSQLAGKYARRKDISCLLEFDFCEEFRGRKDLVSRIAADLLIMYLELNGKIEPCTYTVFRKLISNDKDRVINAIFDSKSVVGISGLYRWKEIMQIRMPAFSAIMSSDLLKGPGGELILDCAFQNSCLFFEQKKNG
jgi:hypothetical protein